jgi:hypothetical protein
VESVVWISERKDVLSLLLGLGTLLAWLRWTEQPTRARYALACGLNLLGLCAKSMLVTLPGLLLLLDHWPLARSRSKSWRDLALEKWPFFAASAGFCVLTFVVQHAAGAVSSTETIALLLRVQNALLSTACYVGASFWPAGLSPYYPYARPTSALPALLLGVALLGSLLLAWRWRARRPALAVGWLWFLGTLVPVIGLVQVGGQSHADRYTYLPGIGLALALLCAPPPGTFARVLGWTLALACIPLFFATRAQAALWKDTRTLFGHALAVTRTCARRCAWRRTSPTRTTTWAARWARRVTSRARSANSARPCARRRPPRRASTWASRSGASSTSTRRSRSSSARSCSTPTTRPRTASSAPRSARAGGCAKRKSTSRARSRPCPTTSTRAARRR